MARARPSSSHQNGPAKPADTGAIRFHSTMRIGSTANGTDRQSAAVQNSVSCSRHKRTLGGHHESGEDVSFSDACTTTLSTSANGRNCSCGRPLRVRLQQVGVGRCGCNGLAAWCHGAGCDGFRMPARTNIAARTRAGVRKPPGKEGARCGAAGSAGAMGIWLAPSVQRRRYAAGRAAGEEHRHPSPAQTGIKSALMQGVARRLPYPRRVIGPNAVVAGWEPAA